MLIILPDRADGLKDLENAFLKNSKNFAHLQGNLTVHNVTLDLPKFKFESSVSLVKTMEKVSMVAHNVYKTNNNTSMSVLCILVYTHCSVIRLGPVKVSNTRKIISPVDS